MKIINVNKFHHIRGGADRYYFELAHILEKFGHKVIPFSSKYKENVPSEYEKYFVKGFTEDDLDKLNIFDKLRIFYNGIYSFDARRKIGNLIDEVNPDIAHLHGLYYQISLSIIDELFKKGIPIVYSLHDWQNVCANAYLFWNGKECDRCKNGNHFSLLTRKCYRNNIPASLMAYFAKKVHYFRKTLDKVTLFTVPHEHMIDKLIEWGFEKERFRVILNPFIYDDIKPYNSEESSDYFVFYGRISFYKGIFTILEAFKKLKNRKLMIFGNGPDVETVRNFIKDNNLNNVTLDTELRWSEDLKDIIGRSIAVISASEWQTPSEYINYESMALGKPIIATDTPGNLGLITEGKNGFIYRRGDVDHLIEKIELMLRSNLNELGSNSRTILEEKVNIEKFYKNIISIYEQAVSST